MLSVHVGLSVVPETRWSRIPEMQEENVADHHHTLTINEFQFADQQLATPLEGRFVGARGEESQSRVVEKKCGHASMSPALPPRKLKVDNKSTFFYLQEALTRKPRFRRPNFVQLFFFLYCVVAYPV